MSSDHTITRARTILVAFMAEIFPVNPNGLRWHILGRDADDPDNLIVVDSKAGGGFNFCTRHHFVYHNHGECLPCRDGAPALAEDIPEETAVQPLNGPD